MKQQINFHSIIPKVCIKCFSGTQICSGGEYLDYLETALDQDLLTDGEVQQSLARLYQLQFELGLFAESGDEWFEVDPLVVNSPETQAIVIIIFYLRGGDFFFF